MAELQPVPRARSPFHGREGSVAIVLGIALLVAIVKPWGSGEPEPSPYRMPTPSPPASEASGGLVTTLHTDLFGPFEPTPEWSIWPAGYFVSVMYVARAPRSAGASPSPGSGPSASPLPGAEWPATIDVGAEDHLLWLGIDTPRGWTLESAVLHRIDPDGTDTVVATRMIPSPWPDHFSVLALGSSGAETSLAVWPAGDYRLALSVSPGDVRRTLQVRIRTIPAPEHHHGGRQR
jgi:hypothetical protein